MNGWSPKDYTIDAGTAINGVVTNQAISRPFPISAGGSRHLVIKVAVTGVTNVGTQTIKLQTAIGDDWVDSKSSTFTANGNVYIKLLAEAAADQTYLPLLAKGRIVLSQTNAGDAVTISSAEVLSEL